MKFKERVLIYEDKLKDTDDQIVDYINNYREEFLSQSIQKTAEILFTVPNTIVRFSKKLGYTGFSDLKFSLKNEKNSISSNEGNEKFSILKNINKTIELMDISIINRVAKKICESKNIYCIGLGDSIYFCEMLTKNLRCVGKKSDFFQHRHDMIYNMEKCDNKDIVIVISVSGETKQLIEAVNIAKERGAYIIALTHLSVNSISELAHANLHYWAPKISINSYNATDRVGISIVTRLLSEAVWDELKLNS
ncbi:MurR/RpiR family transcriptional regulator [Clostridium beijerinckii]|uniref:MurR/RpiR family transcriptional regulator n=1 Tax=Clostridium beijerinckii TaxID=1520 RepID=UPI0012B17EE7|nr:MurR/RpiR family transcriptional regulator [Clostridium beijerinckii]MRY42960.1 SIS domain-containing protein [Parabacteroides distasonis]MZK52106.1 SIS domain-containing protein [Clostridium beijerinckii]MZK61273.1 SIS domain-containing protein [Clostridium beijerinckii]MZK71516.1 SIS domain-containing protein [Clostridium beijerinckii]MZK76875.1 SIS domain-containing protein [Clostridium beijerinckii]